MSFPIRDKLLKRQTSNEIVILERSDLTSEEDIVVTCLENRVDKDRGVSCFMLSDELKHKFLISEDDLKLNKVTKDSMLNEQEDLGQAVTGCNRLLIEKGRKVSYLLGKDEFSIGDFEKSTTITSNRERDDIFQKLAVRSITDGLEADDQIGGISYPTCQLSCGSSKLGDHVEHYHMASMNIQHFGKPKIWNIKVKLYINSVHELL